MGGLHLCRVRGDAAPDLRHLAEQEPGFVHGLPSAVPQERGPERAVHLNDFLLPHHDHDLLDLCILHYDHRAGRDHGAAARLPGVPTAARVRHCLPVRPQVCEGYVEHVAVGVTRARVLCESPASPPPVAKDLCTNMLTN